MEQVHLRYPDDREAGGVLFPRPGCDCAADRQDLRQPEKARAILETVRVEQPNHPGVAHYLIHANDWRKWPRMG